MLKKLFLLLLLVAVAAAGGGFLWLRSWLTPEYLKGKALEEAGRVYKGKIEIAGVDLAFPPAIAVTGVKVSDPTGKREYLSIAGIRGGLDLGALLEKKVRITSFAVDTPRLDWVLDAKGRPVALSHLAASGAPAGSPPPGGSAPAGGSGLDFLGVLVLDDLRVTNGSVRISRPATAPLDVTGLSLASSMSGGVVTVKSFSVTALGTLALSGSGRIRDLASGGRLEDFQVEVLGSMPPGVLDPAVHGALEGDLAVKLGLSGPPAALAGKGTLSARQLTWKPAQPLLPPLPVGPVSGTISVSGGKAVIEPLEATVQGGKVSGKAVAGPGGELLVALSATQVGVGSWLAPTFAAKGLGDPLPGLTADVANFRFTPGKVETRGISAKAGGLSAKGDLIFRMAATGFPVDSGSRFEAKLEGADLVRTVGLASSLLGGTISAVVDLAGDLMVPRLTGSMSAPELSVSPSGISKFQAREVSGQVRFADLVLTVPSLGAKVFGGSFAGETRIDLTALPPRYAVKGSASKFQVEALLAGLMGAPGMVREGELTMGIDLAGTVGDTRTLSGKGEIAALAVQATTSPALAEAASALAMPRLASPALKLDKNSFVVSDGRIKLPNFKADAAGLGAITGNWSVGLDSTLGGNLDWGVLLANQKLPALNGKVLPLKITLGGTLAKPQPKLSSISEPLAALAKAEAQAKVEAKVDKAVGKLEQKLGAKLQEKLGGSAGNLLGSLGLTGTTTAPPGSAGATGSTTAPAIDLKSGARNLLKGLFK